MTNFQRLRKRKISSWPAWGVMDRGYQESLSGRLAPRDWRPPHGGDPEAEWLKWRKATIQLISENIWPAYDFRARSFPADRFSQMHEITAADLSILLDIQNEEPRRFQQPIRSPLAARDPFTQYDFFLFEDAGRTSPGQFHNHYDTTLSPQILAGISSTMLDGLDNKTGNTAAQFKYFLQRPRGFHMSMAWGESNFVHEPALSAYSPAIISGHCLQGLVMAGSVIDRWLLDDIPVSELSFQAMQQWGVDMGDRRVMAGIHYPSDSLASWIVLLSKADQIFESPATKEHLWKAIQRSFVLPLIENFRGREKSKVYEPGLRVLYGLAPAARLSKARKYASPAS